MDETTDYQKARREEMTAKLEDMAGYLRSGKADVVSFSIEHRDWNSVKKQMTAQAPKLNAKIEFYSKRKSG